MIRRLPLVSAVLASLLVAAGVVVFWRANQPGPDGTTDTGGYQPLEPAGTDPYETVYSFSEGWTVLWTGGHVAGAGLVVAGLLLLAGLAGWLLGRRTSRPRTP